MLSSSVLLSVRIESQMRFFVCDVSLCVPNLVQNIVSSGLFSSSDPPLKGHCHGHFLAFFVKRHENYD